MEIKKKKIDIIRKIDKKDNIVKRDVKLIDNLFLNKLYRNYILSHRSKNHSNLLEMIKDKQENQKITEKMIINTIVKKIPPNLLQYFTQFEFKNCAKKLILSSTKKSKSNKSSSPLKTPKAKIYSRNKSNSYRLSAFNSNYGNNTYNDGENTNIFEMGNSRRLFDKKINNQKQYILLYSKRKHSANILRNNYISINDNDTKETKETFDNKTSNNSLNFNINNKIYNTMCSNNIVASNYIFNTNKSENNLTDDITIIKPKSSNYLFKSNYDNYNTYINDNKKSNQINNYNYVKKDNIQKKLFLNLSNSNEKAEKNFDSRVLLGNNINTIKNNFFNLPRKKQKTELLLSSFSPEEKIIIERVSNISHNLNELKRELKTERIQTPKNIKYMINRFNKERKREVEFLRKEVSKSKFYDYFMKNKKYMENKKEIFNILRNSFNKEKAKRTPNENTFIKTLNNICDEEKHFDNIVKQVYKQNYWLRLNKNKKNAENIKNKIDIINSKSIKVKTLISKINKLNIKYNNKYKK